MLANVPVTSMKAFCANNLKIQIKDLTAKLQEKLELVNVVDTQESTQNLDSQPIFSTVSDGGASDAPARKKLKVTKKDSSSNLI